MKVRLGALLAIGILLSPRIAEAHGTFTSAGAFYGGLSHPLLTPSHILLLISVGLCVGPMTGSRLEVVSYTFATGLTAGLVVATIMQIVGLPLSALLVIALLAGGLAALGRDLSTATAAGLAGTAALAVGLDSAPAESTVLGTLISATGTWLGVLAIYCYAVGIVRFATRRPWLKLGVRVLGSWAAASALLVFALGVR